MRLNYKIIIAMFVLAIFAVGAVSAAENVTTDIVDNDIEEINADEIAIDDVSTEDVDGDNDEIISQSNDQTVNSNMNSSQIDEVISQVSGAGGGTVYFEPGTYSGVNLNLKNNVALVGGEGVLLWGNSYNHVIEVANVENFTISGLTINANYLAGNGNVSAIHGSFATNGIISGNTLYNGYNGININKKYDNLTIENNTIHHIIYDGISLANPQNNDYYNTIIGAFIINNNIQSEDYGIFIGGTFKGLIKSNVVQYSKWAIEFLGKPDNLSGYLNANLTNNRFLGVGEGIHLFNHNIIFLNVSSSVIQTNSIFAYSIVYNSNTNKTVDGYVGFFLNNLSGCVLQSFINNIADDFDNINNGTIIPGVPTESLSSDINSEILGCSFLEDDLNILSNSEELIKNPDFSDNLSDWNPNGGAAIYDEGFDGSCVILTTAGDSIYQNIDWTSIDKIAFYAKAASNMHSLVVKIGDTVINQDATYQQYNTIGGPVDTSWRLYEYDTSSYTGFLNLTFSSVSVMGFSDKIYIDLIRYINVYSLESDDVIVNPNFDDGLNGWNYSGTAFPYKNGQNGSCISLIMTSVGAQSASISQNIDWTSIDKLSFYYKSSSDMSNMELYVKIGETQLGDLIYSSNGVDEWTKFEYDVSSFVGYDDLTILFTGTFKSELFIDTIEYELKPLINTSISIDSNEFGNVDISLKDVDGNPIADTNVTYKINGVEFTNATDSEGKIKLSNLLGLITIDANFTGDKVYNSNVTSKKFDFKLNSTISITNESKVITITLTDEKGNAIEGATVNYTINDGETLSNVTLSNGQFIISDVPDEFEIKVQYGGNQTFNAAVDKTMKFNFTTPAASPDGNTSGNTNSGTSGTAAQTTKKATKLASKITAKKKTFKAKKKTKKYTITLKAGKKAIKKVKVTLKVGKKTYKATTNSKGKATFKITKLNKKGKYTAVIKFKGNKTYKASSKKVKITVKK